jgi:exodeoxyribonuclease V gamma subunit
MNVYWSNRLELLAERMFRTMAGQPAASPAAVLAKRQCVIVPNRLVQHWLQQQFLFRDQAQTVLTNVEFPLVHVFVNDGLAQMAPGNEPSRRDPEAHPFGRDALTWRIFHLLREAALLDAPACAPLRDFLAARETSAGASRSTPRRIFQLAARLSTLFDEYMVYRPEMLLRWERRDLRGLSPALHWQPQLWQALTANGLHDQTYLAWFQRMDRNLHLCDAATRYDRLHVFGVSMLPGVYLHFFDRLSAVLPVDFHLLNPSEGDWFIRPSGRRTEEPWQGRPDDEDDGFAPRNTLLGLQGRGNRNFLVELLDRTDGQAEAEGAFAAPGHDTLLHTLQSHLLADTAVPATPHPGEDTLPPAQRSVQLHICHSPLREVEVLRDHLLRWFSEEPQLQPRQVQVLVSDMATYAPYVQAVFATPDANAADAIPFAIADRVAASESAVALAFQQLLQLADSRFTAPEVLDLLSCAAVREAVGIAEQDVEPLKEWLAEAGIRWGRSREHRKDAIDVDFEDYTTWRRGLDRLLLGYACGRHGGQTLPPGAPLPCDRVEGEAAVTLGRFATLLERLGEFAADCGQEHTLAAWSDLLDRAVDAFFAGTDETFGELKLVHSAVARLRKSGAAAESTDLVNLDVARHFLDKYLQDVLGGDFLGGNTVVFSALRPGNALPRRTICLLGMADAQFPRSDNRPAYDLLRSERRLGDRSPRQEDRMAFLEAVLSARDRLYVSYAGFAPEDHHAIPQAIVVTELLDAVEQAAGCRTDPQGRRAPAVIPVKHRLQPYHPHYFLPGAGTTAERPHFSYSATALHTAQALLRRQQERDAADLAPASASADAATAGATAPAGGARVLELDKLIRFFKNPAESYYTDVLGARLDVLPESALAETEMFQPDGLDRYAIHEAIVAALVAPPDPQNRQAPSQVRERLLEQGLLPLGRRGATWFEEQWLAIDAFLGQTIPELTEPLRDAIRRRQGGGAERHLVALPGGVTLSSLLPSPAATDGAPPRLDFGYVKDKAYPRLASWLRHLFVCAALGAQPTIYVRRKDEGDPQFLRWEPLAADNARAQLDVYAGLYLRGQTRPLPFESLSSAAYAKSMRRAGEPTIALQAAEKAWRPFRGEAPSKNLYYRAVFGDQGPMSCPEFAATATTIFPDAPELTP